MQTNNTPNNEIEKDIVKDFFRILIAKDFAHKEQFEDYLKTFLDDDGVFDEDAFETKIDEIYDFISNNDVTCIRPNNSKELEEETIGNVIIEYGMGYEGYPEFTEQILTYIEGGEITMESNPEITEKEMNEINRGIYDYLINYYNEEFFHENVQASIEEIAEKIIEILKNKKD